MRFTELFTENRSTGKDLNLWQLVVVLHENFKPPPLTRADVEALSAAL